MLLTQTGELPQLRGLVIPYDYMALRLSHYLLSIPSDYALQNLAWAWHLVSIQ